MFSRSHFEDCVKEETFSTRLSLSNLICSFFNLNFDFCVFLSTKSDVFGFLIFVDTSFVEVVVEVVRVEL